MGLGCWEFGWKNGCIGGGGAGGKVGIAMESGWVGMELGL